MGLCALCFQSIFAFVAIFCASNVILIASVISTLSNAENVTNVQPARTTEGKDRLAIVTSLNAIRQVIKLLPVSECQHGRSATLISNLQTGQLQQQEAWHTETLKLSLWKYKAGQCVLLTQKQESYVKVFQIKCFSVINVWIQELIKLCAFTVSLSFILITPSVNLSISCFCQQRNSLHQIQSLSVPFWFAFSLPRHCTNLEKKGKKKKNTGCHKDHST